MGQHLKISPTPIKSALGIGFWVKFNDDLKVAIQLFEDNSTADTSGSETAFDPDENTVTDLQNAIDTVLDSLSAIDDAV